MIFPKKWPYPWELTLLWWKNYALTWVSEVMVVWYPMILLEKVEHVRVFSTNYHHEKILFRKNLCYFWLASFYIIFPAKLQMSLWLKKKKTKLDFFFWLVERSEIMWHFESRLESKILFWIFIWKRESKNRPECGHAMKKLYLQRISN